MEPQKVKVKIGESEREVELICPKVKHIRMLKGVGEVEREVELICNLTGIAPDEMDELDLSEYVKLQNALGKFNS